MKGKKKYRDYGKYLEDAYEEVTLKEMYKRGSIYIYGNKKLTITEKNGKLTAEWTDI